MSVSIMFNNLKLKYDELDAILKEDLLTNNIHHLNIFIDSEYVFSFLKINYFNTAVETMFKTADFRSVVVEYFNFLGHYRRYFSKYDITTTFYLVDDSSNEVDCDNNYRELKIKGFQSEKRYKFKNYITTQLLATSKVLSPNTFTLSTNEALSTQLPFIVKGNKNFNNNGGVLFLSNDERFLSYRTSFNPFFFIKTNKNFLNNGNVFSYLQRSFSSRLNIGNELINHYLALSDTKYFNPITKNGRSINSKIIRALSKLESATASNEEVFNSILEHLGNILREDFTFEEYERRLKFFSHEINGEDFSYFDSWINDELSQVANNYNEAHSFNIKFFEGRINLEWLWTH